MSNNKKKNKPAAGKSVAGKTNSKKNNNDKIKQKQREEAEKQAKRIIEEKQKAQKIQQKKSEEIQKRRAKQGEKEQKIIRKTDKKGKRKRKIKRFKKKLRYLFSKEFLSSINYFRVFIFIILPIIMVVMATIGLSRTVILNVPSDILNFEYNGRIESETVAHSSVFNKQQQQVFTDSLKSSGSRKFEFYINSVISIDDDNSTTNLSFGNPNGNKYSLIATIYDKNGQIIYRSLGLESGKEINDAKIFTALPYGLHDVKVAVNAYDKETNEKIGTRFAKIKLAVGVDENGR